MSNSYARLVNHTVVEIITIAEGHTLADCYHADFVNQCVSIPDGTEVEVRSTHDDSGFHAPVAVVVAKSPLMPPLEFQKRFHAEELAAIAQAAMQNAQVFLYMIQMASASVVDLSDAKTIAAIRALEGANLLTDIRATEILTA